MNEKKTAELLYAQRLILWAIGEIGVGLLWVWRDAPEMWVMCFAIAAFYVALLIRAWRTA